MAFTVDTNVPYGNAADVCVEADSEITRVHFTPDPHGGPECLWFCFRLNNNGSAAGEVELVLENIGNMLGGSPPQNMRPVLRYDGGDWQRVEAGQTEQLPDGRHSVRWRVDAPKTFLDFAYCFPYGQSEVENLLVELGEGWKCDTIGVSQAARPLRRLSNDYGAPDGERPGLYLIARQHSGETSGSWVLDGFLRALATYGEAAPLVWTVPLTNIDGVEQGDYGKDNFPYDLNRAWSLPPMRHEVLVLQRDMKRWSERCRPALALDFHAPGACENSGIYCFMPDPHKYPRRHERVLEWAKPMSEALAEYSDTNFCRVARYASRWPTPSFAPSVMERHNVPAFTLEVPYALVGELVFTRERYREAGARMAAAVVEKIAASSR